MHYLNTSACIKFLVNIFDATLISNGRQKTLHSIPPTTFCIEIMYLRYLEKSAFSPRRSATTKSATMSLVLKPLLQFLRVASSLEGILPSNAPRGADLPHGRIDLASISTVIELL